MIKKPDLADIEAGAQNTVWRSTGLMEKVLVGNQENIDECAKQSEEIRSC